MPLFILMRGVPRRGRAGSSAPRSRMSKLFAAFLGLVLGLWQLRDVIAGVLEGDKLAAAGQQYRFVEPSFPAAISRHAAA